MQDATTTAPESEADKPKTRRPAARKAGAKKTTARRSTAKKSAASSKSTSTFDKFIPAAALKASREKFLGSVGKAGGMMKTLGYAQLGIYGKVYDEVSSTVDTGCSKISGRWSMLIKRGEKVQKEMEKSYKGVEARIKKIDIKGDVKEGVEKVKDGYLQAFDKIKVFGKKAA